MSKLPTASNRSCINVAVLILESLKNIVRLTLSSSKAVYVTNKPLNVDVPKFRMARFKKKRRVNIKRDSKIKNNCDPNVRLAYTALSIVASSAVILKFIPTSEPYVTVVRFIGRFANIHLPL